MKTVEIFSHLPTLKINIIISNSAPPSPLCTCVCVCVWSLKVKNYEGNLSNCGEKKQLALDSDILSFPRVKNVFAKFVGKFLQENEHHEEPTCHRDLRISIIIN